MLKPINGHVLIEPVPQDSFIASDRTTYQEIGVVIDADSLLLGPTVSTSSGDYKEYGTIQKGDKVYFDSWLAAKFPKDRDTFYWLVKYEDIRAIERAEQE